MTAQEMLNQAVVELGNLNDGDVFIVRDLFKGHVWNAQDRTERLTLGTLFLNFAKQNRKSIEILDKNTAGQQMYKLMDGLEFRPLGAKNCLLKTGVMQVASVSESMIIVVVGTSGLDRHEFSIQSSADVERVASVFHQVLKDWKK